MSNAPAQKPTPAPVVRVSFYGTPEAMEAWRALVQATTGAAVTDVVADTGLSARFDAAMGEDGCAAMMAHWHEVAPGQGFQWNARVSFVKRRADGRQARA